MLERNRAGRLARRLIGPYAVVSAGGCAGTTLRAWIGELLPGGAQAWMCTIPWTTPTVNLASAFLLGLLAGLLTCRFPHTDPRVCLFLGTGFLDSFTTYGMFTTEVETATTAQAAACAAGSIACGLLYTWGGLSLGTRARRENTRRRSARRRDRLADESEPEASA